MADYEKLGAFYLGRRYDLEAGRVLDEPLLYDARDLTSHAVCVGMTGSGKTGLCIGLLEEAAIDGIPALETVRDDFDAAELECEELSIRPAKADLGVERVALVWTPWRIGADGRAEPAY